MKLFTQKSTLLFWSTFILCLLAVSPLHAQNLVSGKVTDALSNAPLTGVSIVQKGTGNGTTTDKDGVYHLSVPKGSSLTVSYVGYDKQELIVSSGTLDIALTATSNMLEDVVVIGYGAVRRKDVTTAISSVSTKDLEQRPIVNVAQAIQGKAAGVAVVQPNGTPGAEMSIRVRGTTSFNGSNDPLYVVDGVPVDNIRFLSANDITDMQILKDASSAAIYGSRAANGVILITTKAGATGQAKISLNAQLTHNVVSNSFDVLNTEQYRELQNEIGVLSLPNTLADQTDWFKETYKTGRLQNYQLSVSDGTEKLKYFLSAGYVNETGVLDAAYFKRYNFRANIDNQIRTWLKVNANITYSDYANNGVSTGVGANRGGVVLSVVNTPTYAPIWDPEHPKQYYNNFYGISNITNPLENIARSKDNRDKENRLIASGNALISFLPTLNLKSSFTLDRRNAWNTRFLDPITTDYGRNQHGEGSDLRNMNTVLTWDNVLTYKKTIGLHNIEGMGGTSWTDSHYTNSYIYGSYYNDELVQTLNAANRISWDATGSGASGWTIMSYFARAMYNYDGKYLLTANFRSDGSSKLHPDSRWGYFPSFSAAWRLSSEPFLSDISWINDLKIRGGWGQTGNQSGIGDYAYLMLYNFVRKPWYQEEFAKAVPGLAVANLRTSDLTWETTSQSGLGVDFMGLDNRLSVSLDYYYKRTTDMLMFLSLPEGPNAINTLVRNEGTMVNKGFEVTIGSKNVRGPLNWETDFNISFNRNKLEDLALQQLYSTAVTSNFVNEAVVRNEPGRSLGGFFGYISDGVNPETGELMYRDLNGDGKLSVSDRTYIGDPNPKFTYGMTNNFSWKNFDLGIFIQGTYGNDIFNASRIETEGMYDGKNQTTRVLDRWQIPGQITDVPKAGFNIKNSTYFIENGSYLRVKNISLSYNFKGDQLQRIGIFKLQPYISASNLLTWTKYTGMDPEVNQYGNNGAVQGIDWGTYPHSRSFVVGVNVEF
ncbi:SusC/RagA family TonB-linked outer membrane protein [Sphingobacterium sp. SYP-B4668]|uniref:SusC/RagA family TonB-linked outer membrane protein n=1 Tax=Sphingobacterium sp. SYP-B4668 TaxID=2996035 RepID=UPI0022DDF914|nr:TonB-dependent receptor [Sphingobacterium sp. SYP-B4668]